MFKRLIDIILGIWLILLILFILFITVYKNKKVNTLYLDNKVVGHALYGINGVEYTNSYEALLNGYNKGIRIMETDFLLTSDNYLILNHFWNDKISTKEEFINSKILNQYTPLSIEELLIFMENHKDLYIIIDTKENEYNNYNELDVYNKIVADVTKYNKELLDRFIPQIYNFSDYSIINSIYPFKNYIFTIYKLKHINIYQITYYCLLFIS